jgi:anti-sigma factor RsiW
MKGVHLDSELQDLFDGRADAVVRSEAEDHLRACAECRRRLAALEAVRTAVRARSGPAELPPELAERLRGALDREDRTARVRSRPVRWAWVAAGAIAAAAVLLIVLLPRGRAPDMVDQVIRQYRAETSALPPRSLRTGDIAALEGFLRAQDLPFSVRVLDLGMMRWELVGGGVEQLGGAPSAVLVYRRDGRILVCRMYLGSTASLPPTADVEEHRGSRFQVYERDGLTAVFWQEGDTVCVLVSDLGRAEVVDLAVAKAMAPS